MATEIYELLNHFDLDESNYVDRADKLGSRKLRTIQESLWNAIYRYQYDREFEVNGDQSFRFLAGPSIRGENCVTCRPGKLDFLARYAALYSDFVILPLPLDGPEEANTADSARWGLRSTLQALFQLRVPIEAGIIRPAVMATAECEHTMPKTRELVNSARLFASELADEYFEQFTMYYEPNFGSNRPPTLYIQGPADYLEHGYLAVEYPEPPSWVAKSWRLNAKGRVLVPTTKARRTGWVDQIFDRIALNTTFHMAYGTLWRAKFLTDLRGETVLMDGFDDEHRPEMQSAALFKAMSHSLPFIDNLPISDLLKLRNEIRESFEQYRLAISSIVSTHSKGESISKRIANEICMSELAPKIAALETRITAEKKRFKGKLATSSGVVGLVVALGMSGILTLPQVLGLLGGAASLRAADLLNEARFPAIDASTQDLYFLLRLKQARRPRRGHPKG